MTHSKGREIGRWPRTLTYEQFGGAHGYVGEQTKWLMRLHFDHWLGDVTVAYEGDELLKQDLVVRADLPFILPVPYRNPRAVALLNEGASWDGKLMSDGD